MAGGRYVDHGLSSDSRVEAESMMQYSTRGCRIARLRVAPGGMEATGRGRSYIEAFRIHRELKESHNKVMNDERLDVRWSMNPE